VYINKYMYIYISIIINYTVPIQNEKNKNNLINCFQMKATIQILTTEDLELHI